MLRNKALLFLVLVSALASSSCTLHHPKGGGGGGGGGGNATVSFTLVSDTLPANPSILSFNVSVTSIQLKPTTGAAITLTPSTSTVDLMRLQSDTAFLGTLSKVPAGTYTMQVSLSTPATGSTITFFNDSGASLMAGSTTCAINTVCAASLTSTGNPTISSFTLTVGASTNQGVELDFNLANVFSIAAGALSLNLNPSAPSPVFTAIALPRQGASLGSNQLELIEDFTGVVSLNGNNVTIQSPTRGSLMAINGSASFFDPSPDSTLCLPPATFACVANGQIASIDAYLNSDGTLALKEFEPLLATPEDLVEGIVYTVSGTSEQFGIVVTDKTNASTGSLIGSVNPGDLVTVHLAALPPLQPFSVDQKGLPVSSSGIFTLFSGQTSVSAIHQGQTVSVHISNFTVANGSTPASVVADTVTLRWSRFTGNDVNNSGLTLINLTLIPSYFGSNSGSLFAAQVYSGTPGTDGVTEFDTSGGLPVANLPVALRALYLQNATNSGNPAFVAAKVRQH